MQQYIDQILQLVPLFFWIFFGYSAGKLFNIKNYSIIPKLLLLVFWPILVFNAISTTQITLEYALLPLIFLGTTSLLAISSRKIAARGTRWDRPLINTFAYSSGSGNVIYFGLPALLAILGEQYLPVILISVIGYILYDNTVGYLIISEEKLKFSEVLIKLLKFPPIIGILVGLLALLFSVSFEENQVYMLIVDSSRRIMSTLGIILIGLAVAQIKGGVERGYIALISVMKVFVNPLFVLLILLVDKYTFGYLQDFALVLLLIGSVPVASNAVVLATQYSKREQTAALGVLATAILSLLSIPFWQMVGGWLFG